MPDHHQNFGDDTLRQMEYILIRYRCVRYAKRVQKKGPYVKRVQGFTRQIQDDKIDKCIRPAHKFWASRTGYQVYGYDLAFYQPALPTLLSLRGIWRGRAVFSLQHYKASK